MFKTDLLAFVPKLVNKSGYPATFKNLVNNAG